MNKQITLTFILFLFSALILGQTKAKVTHMTPLDLAAIDHAEMYKYTKMVEDSTMGAIHKHLNSEQIKFFVEQWNTAVYEGVCKFRSKYRIDIYLKDGSKRFFHINGTVKEERNYCYKPIDKKYLKKIWKNADN